MARRPFSTSIENDLLMDFKEKCNDDGIACNDALEEFMKLYISGQVSFERKVILSLR